MALTREIITALAPLNGLTDEQVNAIVAASASDEEQTMGRRIGEIYRQMDVTIAAATGVERNGDEKTYNYLPRALASLNAKVNGIADLQQQITDLTAEKTRLEKVIADGGGNEETAKQLKQAQADLASITTKYTELQKEKKTLEENHTKELLGVRIESELQSASSGFTFNVPDSVANIVLNQVVSKVKAMNPEYIDAAGGKVLAFKDANGAIMYNPQDITKPIGARSLIEKELKEMGVLKIESGGGGGTKPIVKKTTTGGYDLTGVKTQLEATQRLKAQLAAEGKVATSAEYQQAFDQAWNDNNISSLPIQ